MKNLIILTLLVALFASDKLIAQEKYSTEPSTFARFVPERKDDFAWENDKVAFRAYGPALRQGKESSGIDCWFKKVDYPIVNKWYAQSKEGLSYHEDHGEGLDSYHVGPSAGCGGTGIWLDGKRKALETFTESEVLKVSKKVSSFTLTYEHEIDGHVYKEEKTITIKLGSQLFSAECVFYKDGEPAANLPICVGVSTSNGKAEAFSSMDNGWIACWEKIKGTYVGTAAKMNPNNIQSIETVISDVKDESHIFIIASTDAKGKLSYSAGCAWSEAGEITTKEDWVNYLNNLK